MPEPVIKIFKDIDSLSQSAAQTFIEIAEQAIKEHGRFYVSLSGGNTPTKLYELLGSESNRSQIDWTRTHFFWGDERCVPMDDPGNCYGQAKKAFLDSAKVPTENIHRVESELKPAEAAVRYAATLKQFADRPLAWPRFDLVLLGMGDDGHTASLFPGSPVEADTPTRAVVANYQDRPANRVTLIQSVFNDAREIWFLVTGKSKAETLLQVIRGERKLELYPAQRIQPKNGTVTWFLDEAAGSKL